MTIVHRRPPLVIVFPISRGSIKTIMLDTVSTIALWAIPAILAITLHEAAHGYVAKLCGDRTAWVLGHHDEPDSAHRSGWDAFGARCFIARQPD